MGSCLPHHSCLIQSGHWTSPGTDKESQSLSNCGHCKIYNSGAVTMRKKWQAKRVEMKMEGESVLVLLFSGPDCSCPSWGLIVNHILGIMWSNKWLNLVQGGDNFLLISILPFLFKTSDFWLYTWLPKIKTIFPISPRTAEWCYD